jgi:cyclic pyranopterin phosphate synthase
MDDSYGRRINYLRLSVTDRCNLNCLYCQPGEGPTVTPPEELLTAAEIERVVRAAVAVGFDKLRLTGGEPTVRRDIVEIVERLAPVPGLEELLMTTNGVRLQYLAEPFYRAGLRRVNIHVDTLNATRVQRLMGLGAPQKVWDGIMAAERVGLVPIKLNMVLTRGYNDMDVVDMAQLTLEHDWHVRFIELMPLGDRAQFAYDYYVPAQEAMDRVQAALGELSPLYGGELVGEARLYRLPGARGTLGFINPVSDPYCDSCNHLRITADGQLRLCLLADQELSLREMLRAGGSQDDLVALFRQAIAAKPFGLHIQHGHAPAGRTMVRIGG